MFNAILWLDACGKDVNIPRDEIFLAQIVNVFFFAMSVTIRYDEV